MAKTKSLWCNIKAAYITGDESCRDLAKKFGVSESQIFRRCTKEAWVEAREAYQSKVTAEAIAAVRARAVKDKTQLLELSQGLTGEILRALSDPQQLYKYIVQGSNGKFDERTFSKIDAKAVKNLASALKDLYPIVSQTDSADEKQISVVLDPRIEEYSV